jgi:hypothetical protein
MSSCFSTGYINSYRYLKLNVFSFLYIPVSIIVVGTTPSGSFNVHKLLLKTLLVSLVDITHQSLLFCNILRLLILWLYKIFLCDGSGYGLGFAQPLLDGRYFQLDRNFTAQRQNYLPLHCHRKPFRPSRNRSASSVKVRLSSSDDLYCTQILFIA